MLEVDGEKGKQPFWLAEVLLIETMDFNILSLQKLRAAGFIPMYDKVEGKVVINKRTLQVVTHRSHSYLSLNRVA